MNQYPGGALIPFDPDTMLGMSETDAYDLAQAANLATKVSTEDGVEVINTMEMFVGYWLTIVRGVVTAYQAT